MDSITHFFERMGLTGTVIGSAILLFLGWLFGKAKQSAETLKARAEANKISTEELILLDEYKEKKILELTTRVEKNEKEIGMLRNLLSTAEKENNDQKRELNMLRNYRTLKR